jgi:glutathione S-transferase
MSLCSAANLGDRLSGLRIYGIARTRAFRALWMANELGLDYEHLPIEIGTAGARSPEFLAINPNGRLPFIVDNGFVLFESLTITLYLEKKHSYGKLYPGTLEGEATVWQWSLWAVTEVDRGVNIWSLHAVRLRPAERDAIKRHDALKVLVAPFKVLDAAVAKNHICSATTSRWPISKLPRSLAAPSTWTLPQRRTSRPGSRAVSRGRLPERHWRSGPWPTMKRRRK